METTHEFKPVHDPLFSKEKDIAFVLNTEKEFQTTENKFYKPGDIPACDPDNSCEVIQDFLEDGVDEFSIFRNIQSDYYGEIYQCQNRIEECKKKIRAEIEDIQVYKQKLDEAFNHYIK